MRVLNVASRSLLSLATNLLGPVRRGPQASIATISNEIFFEIFDKMLPHSKERAVIEAASMIRSLSSVCRRFREMVLAFPRVWAVMNLGWLSEDDFERHLVLSKNMPLHIEFDYTDSMEHVLLRALEHKDRWAYLACSFEFGEWGFLDSSQPMVFPSLRTLRAYVGCQDINPRCDEFFSAWRFPKVEDLALRHHVPKQGAFDLSSLTSFKYTPERGVYHRGHTFPASLTCFLRPASSLRSLELDLTQLSGQTTGDGAPPLVLPSLSQLTITNSNQWQRYALQRLSARPPPWRNIASIIGVLRTPNVQKLTLSVTVLQDAHINIIEWLQMAFHPSDDLKRMTQFEFKFQVWCNALDEEEEGQRLAEIPVYDLFWLFPQLRDLSIGHKGCFYSFWNTHNVRLERLRSLRLRNWFSPQRDLSHMISNLRYDGATALEEIRIHSQQKIERWSDSDLEHARSEFPNTKIKVVECRLVPSATTRRFHPQR